MTNIETIKSTVVTVLRGRIFNSTTDQLRHAIVPAMVQLGDLPSNTASQIRGIALPLALETIERISSAEHREVCEKLLFEYKEHRAGRQASSGNPIASDITNQIAGIIQNAMANNSPSVSTAQIQDEIQDALTPVRDQVEDLQRDYSAFRDALKGSPSKMARAKVATASSDNVILKKVLPYYPDQGPCLKILVTSPPSYGKSYSIRQLGKAYDLYLEHGCSDNIDEETTLVGSTVPDGNGGFAVVDGVLTQAVRAASEGKRVLLFLDEVLRWPIVSQEFLLSFLEPNKASGDPEYVLRTRHMKNGACEVIRCKVQNLHIIAAGNRSANSITEAFWSRWHKVNIKFDLDDFATICKQIADTYELRFMKRIFADAAKLSRDRYNEMKVKAPIDCRTLVNALEWAGSDDWADIRKWIQDNLEDQLVESDARTGDPLNDSLDAIEEIKLALA